MRGSDTKALLDAPLPVKNSRAKKGRRKMAPAADNASEFAAETCFAPGHAVSSCGLHAQERIVMESGVGVNPLLTTVVRVTSL
jgi:hypothetical protein